MVVVAESQRIDKFVEKHPKLYHMAEAGSWASIRQHGLLSVAALLDLFEIKGKRRYKLFSTWRPYSVTVEHPTLGTAIVRDQHPMPPDKLGKALKEGCRPSDWHEALNKNASFGWTKKDSTEC